MKPADVALYRYSLPLTEPIVLKKSTLIRREGALIRLTADDGSTGWGETAPLPGFSPETLQTAVGQLYESAAVVREGGNPEEQPAQVRLVPSVRFGLDLALKNLSAGASESPLLRIVNGLPLRDTVNVNGLLSGKRESLVEEADRMRSVGYRAVKLKVGGRNVAEDVRLVREVGEALGDGVSLRLDANRAWGFGEALEFGHRVSGVGIEYVEEPLAEPGRLGELAGLWGLPVALDESLVGMEPEGLRGKRYAEAVVLKPTLVGGISRSLRFAEEARALGMRVAVSSSYESGVGTGALVALAAAIGDEPVGLDTYRRLAADVIEAPLSLQAPVVNVRRAVEEARRVDLRTLERLPE